MNQEPRLNTWKEIADYLGVSVRTAQNYERQERLPVHRTGSDRSRVWAYASELDAWKILETRVATLGQSGSAQEAQPAEQHPSQTAQAPVAGSGKRGFRPIVLILAGLFLAVVLAGGFYVATLRTAPPSDFTLEGSSLVVRDKDGAKLWRHAFPYPFQMGPYTSGPRSHRPWFGPIDNSSHINTLFSYFPVNLTMQGASLFCFSQNGDVEWEFRPGRRVADKQKEFSNIYYPAAFRVFRNKDSRRTKVVVSSNHSAFYPDQVAVLGTDGKLISEYWHSGHLLWMQSLDLDGDGTDEILLSGVNDGYRQATLVVFNQDKISGASVEPGGDFHQLQGFGAGTERAVVLFPKSCLSRLEAFNRAAEIRVTETGFHVFVTESIFEAAPHYIIYEFDRNLQVRSVTLSAAYETRHKNLEAEGKLDHAFSPKEAETLKSLVRIVRKQ